MKHFALILLLFPLILRAEDWTTTDGKVYKNVQVLKVEADAVTILDDEGGGLVRLGKLPPALQRRFHYNPAAAAVATMARAKSDNANALALQAEQAQYLHDHTARLIAEDAASHKDQASVGGGASAGSGAGAGSGVGAGAVASAGNGADSSAAPADVPYLLQTLSDLEKDLAFRQRQVGVVTPTYVGPTGPATGVTSGSGAYVMPSWGSTTHGDYDEKIRDDEQAIAIIKAKLKAAGVPTT